MKSLFVALMVLAPSAFALEGSFYGEPVVPHYISWCEKDLVISQDREGNLFVKEDCGAQRLKCEQKTRQGGRQVISFAVCAPYEN